MGFFLFEFLLIFVINREFHEPLDSKIWIGKRKKLLPYKDNWLQKLQILEVWLETN